MDPLRRTLHLVSLSLLSIWVVARSFCLGASALTVSQSTIQLGVGIAAALAWSTIGWMIVIDGRSRRIHRGAWVLLPVAAGWGALLVHTVAEHLERLLAGCACACG